MFFNMSLFLLKDFFTFITDNASTQGGANCCLHPHATKTSTRKDPLAPQVTFVEENLLYDNAVVTEMPVPVTKSESLQVSPPPESLASAELFLALSRCLLSGPACLQLGNPA
jgi:hypothetical protein